MARKAAEYVAINWKEAARHFRWGRFLAEQQEIRLKQEVYRLNTLVGTLSRARARYRDEEQEVGRLRSALMEIQDVISGTLTVQRPLLDVVSEIATLALSE